MKAFQTSLLSFASPASFAILEKWYFWWALFERSSIRSVANTVGVREEIGHWTFWKDQGYSTTRAFPFGCWADFGYFCQGSPVVAQPHLLIPWSQKGPFVKRDSRGSWFLVRILARQPDSRMPSAYLRHEKGVTTGDEPAWCPSSLATTLN